MVYLPIYYLPAGSIICGMTAPNDEKTNLPSHTGTIWYCTQNGAQEWKKKT